MATTKRYTVKPPSRKILKKYWKMMEEAEDRCLGEIYKIEKLMAEETGVKDIEFFRSPDDGCYCGVGNSSRTMKLIQNLR